MDLKPTKPMSGFIELLPAQQRCFDECARRMQNVLKIAGFEHLDLPAIERAEVLTDKDNWDEIETQMFLFQKGDTKMGLRYDGTVGLARYVAGHLNDLAFPFRAYQFARNYRGERPQRGRYREFYQMDLDIMGKDNLSTNYDAEIIATLARAYDSIKDLVGATNIRIGNRKICNLFFKHLGLTDEQQREMFILIDKKDKMGEDAFMAAVTDVVGADAARGINRMVYGHYQGLGMDSPELEAAVWEMTMFMDLLGKMGVYNAVVDLSIMRGHSYYTGIVFEFFLDNFPELGAVGGGGRYENLASKFSKTKIVGVGAAVGFSRLMVALMDADRIDLKQFSRPIDVAILIIGEQNVARGMEILQEFRECNVPTVAYLDADKKLKAQFEYANKIGARYCIMVGDDEVARHLELHVKDMDRKEGHPLKEFRWASPRSFTQRFLKHIELPELLEINE